MADSRFRCPNGHIGIIDEEQEAGDVSIICTVCDFHGYVGDGDVLEPQGGQDV